MRADKHCRTWTEAEREDVAEVIMFTNRDDTGISYDVRVALRSLAASAFEDSEEQLVLWSMRVDFDSSGARSSGGPAFVHAARVQASIAAEISAVVWGAS
jgi:hypothetical protein